MKCNLKKQITAFITVLALSVFTFGGCGEDENGDSKLTMAPIMTETPTPGADLRPFLKDVTYYTLTDAYELEEATAVLSIETELTPDYLAEYVAESFDDVSIEVKIDHVSASGKALVISFEEDSAPAVGVDEETEGLILDALAQSLLENFSDYSQIVFHIMDSAYVSKHKKMDINYVYMGR